MRTHEATPHIRKVRQCLAVISCTILASGWATSSASAAKQQAPSDSDINRVVDSDLLFDSSVPSNEIDITTHNGIVTLSGTAPNLLAKERARAIAATARGVRAVVNNITVKPVSRKDAEIRKDVESALLADPATDSYEIKTSVKSGNVTLTGAVDSWTEKRLAATVAKGVKGVTRVKNEITVVYDADRLETELEAEIEAALRNDVWVEHLLIDTAVDEGTVTLTGTVGSVAEKDRAVSLAWVVGVDEVDAESLEVEPWVKDSTKKKPGEARELSDADIENAVKAAMLYDPRLKPFNPEVAVDNGVVTLTGIVDNLKAKRAAEQDAQNTGGVWRVRNYLRVRSEDPPTDDQLVKNVQDALKRDPYIDRYEIVVSALSGVIYLNGLVDSYYEKYHADDVASRVNGVKDVRNDLDVSYPSDTHYYWPHYSEFYEPPNNTLQSASERWPVVSDAELKEEIAEEMFWSPFVGRSEVKISIDNGVATLTGTVDSWNEYNAATENAYEGGASRVLNKLKVD